MTRDPAIPEDLVTTCETLFGPTNPVDVSFLRYMEAAIPGLAGDLRTQGTSTEVAASTTLLRAEGIGAAVFAATVLSLRRDRYAVRDFWVQHGYWEDLEFIAAACGERLPLSV